MRRQSQLRRDDGEQRVLLVLQRTPMLSHDHIAISTNYARCTVQRIITRLIRQSRVIVVRRGAGRYPNRYEVVRPQQYRLL